MFDPPFRRLSTLVEALAPVLAPYMERPFAFFGHSMGALVSFELCRHLRRHGQILPVGLFVSGHRAPHVPDDDPPIYALPDAAFIQELRELNGTPQAILEDTELMEIALPGIRADFELCSTYDHIQEPPLELPIWAFGGLQDPDVSRQDVDAWRHHTASQFSLAMLPGDHFFIESARPYLLQRIAQELYRLQSMCRR